MHRKFSQLILETDEGSITLKVELRNLSIDVIGIILQRNSMENSNQQMVQWPLKSKVRLLELKINEIRTNLVCFSLTLSWWNRRVQEQEEVGFLWLCSLHIWSKRQELRFQVEPLSSFKVNWGPDEFIKQLSFFLLFYYHPYFIFKVKTFLIHFSNKC